MGPQFKNKNYSQLWIKSLVTLTLTGLFVYLAAQGRVSARDFITIFSVVIAFYFGSQSQNGDEQK